MATVRLNGLLENDFVVVEWDQRGSGKSRAAIRPATAMNVGQLVADTIELTEHLTQRFGRRKLIVVGHSWGSVLGLMAVLRRPDPSVLSSAPGWCELRRGQQVAYRFPSRRVTAARGTPRQSLSSTRWGPAVRRHRWRRKWRRCARSLGEFGTVWRSSEKFDRVGWMLASIEYSWPEKLRFNRAAEHFFDLLYADLLSVNLSETVPRVEVPVFSLRGVMIVWRRSRWRNSTSRASSRRGRNWCGEFGALPAVGREGTVPRVPR